jgi:hypothetical protein
MGMFLIIWDRIFGTFQEELPEERYQEIKYGLTKNLDDKSAANLILHEWRAIKNDLCRRDIPGRTKWKYLFGPPGWSHDGSRATSKQVFQNESDLKTAGSKTEAIAGSKTKAVAASPLF